MRCLALEYHDIVRDDPDASGFPGGAAASYKLGAADFAAHLDAIAQRGIQVTAVDRIDESRRDAVLLTFDDGGVSALTEAGPALGGRGWPGHFFVTTGQLGAAGFLSGPDLRALRSGGHVVGSHSRSHPLRFSALTRSAMLAEWRDSRAALEDVLGEPVRAASVPGGYFSRAAAETAAEAGYTALFTSEPTARIYRVDGCRVIGRFTLRRWSTPAEAAALATGNPRVRARQWAAWNAKKLVKATGLRAYLALRERLLER